MSTSGHQKLTSGSNQKFYSGNQNFYSGNQKLTSGNQKFTSGNQKFTSGKAPLPGRQGAVILQRRRWKPKASRSNSLYYSFVLSALSCFALVARLAFKAF